MRSVKLLNLALLNHIFFRSCHPVRCFLELLLLSLWMLMCAMMSLTMVKMYHLVVWMVLLVLLTNIRHSNIKTKCVHFVFSHTIKIRLFVVICCIDFCFFTLCSVLKLQEVARTQGGYGTHNVWNIVHNIWILEHNIWNLKHCALLRPRLSIFDSS